MTAIRRGLLALALVAAGPASAQLPFPIPDEPTERAVAPDVARAIARSEYNLATLDSLLARLSSPTPLRGVLQCLRAMALLKVERVAEAKTAAEEGVRLSPGMAQTRMMASYVLTWAGTPQAAAGYWLEASRLAPSIAQRSDEYTLSVLLMRLREVGDVALADRLSARIAELGVVTLRAPARSDAGLTQVRAAFAKGGEKTAAPLIGTVLAPADMIQLFVDRTYQPLWPAIATWSGDDFAGLSARYLEELRGEWWARGDIESAVNYARVLGQARAWPAMVTAFAPLLSAERTREYQPHSEFLAPLLARALRKLGRAAEADAMVKRVSASMPKGSEVLQLNLSAVAISNAYDQGQWATMVEHTTPWLQQAERVGVLVTGEGILRGAAYHICGLQKLGRDDEAGLWAVRVELAAPTIPRPALIVATCRNDLATARTLLVAGLERKETKRVYLDLLQPEPGYADDPPQTVKDRLFMDRLRADPEVRAAIAKVGRILPKPFAPTIPEGFDPTQEGPAPKPQPDSV